VSGVLVRRMIIGMLCLEFDLVHVISILQVPMMLDVPKRTVSFQRHEIDHMKHCPISAATHSLSTVAPNR
jgi:hypothetical protein